MLTYVGRYSSTAIPNRMILCRVKGKNESADIIRIQYMYICNNNNSETYVRTSTADGCMRMRSGATGRRRMLRIVVAPPVKTDRPTDRPK